MCVFWMMSHLFVTQWDCCHGYIILVLLLIQGAGWVLVSADQRLIQGLFQQTGINVMPVTSQITETVRGQHRLDCALLCARSSVCLSYSITNLSSSTSRAVGADSEEFVCRLSDISSLGPLLSTSPSDETTLYARRIIFCGEVDPSLKEVTGKRDELELTVVNRSGRRISVLRFTDRGLIAVKSRIPDSDQWRHTSALQGDHYVASDDYGQIVPLQGNCHFTKGEGTETITADFGF